MKLTERATQYIETLHRDPQWITKEAETKKYLKRLNTEYSEKVLEVQLKFGGIELSISNTSSFNRKLNFISQAHIRKQSKIHSERINDELLFQFDNGEEPSFFFITNDGIICTKNKDNPKKLHLTYETIETKIEQYALLNEYYFFTSFSSGNCNVLDLENLKNELAELTLISECSDSFNFCYKNDFVIVLISPWLDEEGHFINVYGINPNAWKEIVKRLQAKDIIE